MHLLLYKLVGGLERKYFQEVIFVPSNLKFLTKNIIFNERRNLSNLILKQVNNVFLKRNTFTTLSAMANSDYSGLPLKTVVDTLNLFAPTSLAESWDNVGLLVEPMTPKHVKKILLTNDLTEEVMVEAVDVHADLIISYHPPIFVPLKSVTTRTWKERVIAACIENRIALFSPHTSYDSVKGGVNDWLTSAFDTKEVSVIFPAFSNSDFSLVEITFPNNAAGSSAMAEFQSKWDESMEGSRGKSVCSTISGDFKLSIPCSTSSLPKLVEMFNSSNFGLEKERFNVIKYEKVTIPGHGIGRICLLKNPLRVEEVVQLVKNHIKRPYVRLALAVGKNLDSPVSSIAICAGSGASVLKGAKADLYLTGEMLHHDVLEAAHRGSHVILCNHSDSERGFLSVFAPKLSHELLEGKVEVVTSKKDRDPLITV